MENAEVVVGSRPGKPGEGPKYFVDIEGKKHDWDDDQITVPEIRSLGSLPADLPVLMIDLRTNVQRTLAEDEVVDLKPGMGFAQKFQFKRG